MLVRVAFTATRTQSQSSTTETTLVFSNALTNIGGGYNAVTGVFTAPLGGVYVFICKITERQNSGGPTIYFVKNGASQGSNVGTEGPSNSFRSSSSSIVLELSPGDRVWLKIHGNYYARALDGNQLFTGFMLWHLVSQPKESKSLRKKIYIITTSKILRIWIILFLMSLMKQP